MSVLVTGTMGHVGYMTAMACAEAGLEVIAHYHATYNKSWAQAACRDSILQLQGNNDLRLLFSF